MRISVEQRVAIFGSLGLMLASVLAGCGPGHAIDADSSSQAAWSAYLADGDIGSLAPAAMKPPMSTPPPRFCPGNDCTRQPLALWTFDDCNLQTSQLSDSANSSFIPHPAFRALSVACVAGRDGQAVRLAGSDDVVYAPDQPDFVFDAGLTVAA